MLHTTHKCDFEMVIIGFTRTHQIHGWYESSQRTMAYDGIGFTLTTQYVKVMKNGSMMINGLIGKWTC